MNMRSLSRSVARSRSSVSRVAQPLIVTVCVLICLAIIAAVVLRAKLVRARALELPDGLQWNVSSYDPNDSVIMRGTNVLMSGAIMLKIDGRYIYGLCGDKAFVIDSANADAGVSYANHMFEIADKFKFGATVAGLETFYDHRKRSR